jgi:hypothetical protein
MRMTGWAAVAAMLAGAPALAVEVPGYYPTAGNSVVTTSDATATAGEIATFLGAPNDLYTGIGQHWVLYSFTDVRIFNGAGQDLSLIHI